jgi:UDP-galactopyranose mutase
MLDWLDLGPGITACDRLICTGPIDDDHDLLFGFPPQRSLWFRPETLDQAQALSTGTISFPQTAALTRVSQYKHVTGQVHPQPTITREDPSILRPEQQALFKRVEKAPARRATLRLSHGTGATQPTAAATS